MANFAGGYTGQILRVDLTNQKISREQLNPKWAESYIGGRGLNLKYLFDEIKPGIDPLGPYNKIIISAGPCSGTLTPGGQRFTATAKSPLTGFIGDSNCGADFGAELKYAGYDMLIVEGRSEFPVYLWIKDDHVQIRKADDLWGKATSQTRLMIEQDVYDPDACVLSIGTGGENMVRFGNVIADVGRSLGRTGIGAVFGSKKLKAIAVRGSGSVKVADYVALKDFARKNFEAWRNDTRAYEAWSRWGPCAGWTRYTAGGMLCTKNFQAGTFEPDLLDQLKNYFIKQKACISCPLGCNHSFFITNGPYTGTYGDGIELSALGDAGPKLGNHETAVCLKVKKQCDDYGVDLFDMTGIIAWLFECVDRGILSTSDVEGVEARWGNAPAILKLMEMTAFRRGLGSILAEGLKKASEIIGNGSEEFAMHVKGQGLVMREPRASKGWGLGYAVSSRGACHMRNAPPEGPSLPGTPTGPWEPSLMKLVEKYNDPTNPHLEEGKPEIVKWFEDLRAFQNSLEICIFSCYSGIVKTGDESLPEILAGLYSSVTGRKITAEDALEAGERIVNLERIYNMREGLSRQDDTLPKRMLEEPLPDGPAKGQIIDLKPMVDRYYEIRGWDRITGIPGREKLLQLGLSEAAGNPD